MNDMKAGETHWKLIESGISPEVAAARGYVPWTKGDPQVVKDAYADLPQGSRSTTTRWARQSDGLLIVRHAPARLVGLPKIYAEMRPDEPVRKPPMTHYHPSEPLPRGVKYGDPGWPLHPTTREPLHPKHVLRGAAAQVHIERAKDSDDHNGVNREDVHTHEKTAKYVFAPGPKKTVTYVDRNGVLCAKRVSDRSFNIAKRIDVNPLAEALFETAERVFFAIEGCIKADAILSRGEAVFSVPSVTLWDAPELPKFVRMYLRGKVVYIVPDADGFTKRAVMRQALLCRSRLRRLGIEAYIAAPPFDPDRNGVDDFLVAGGSLDDLVVIGREAPRIEQYAAVQRGANHRWLAEDLEALSLHAQDDGTFRSSLRTLAKTLNTKPAKVAGILQQLIDLGPISTDRPLETKVSYWSKKLEWKGEISGWPALTIRENLRATETRVPLWKYRGEVSPRLRVFSEALIGPWRPWHEQRVEAIKAVAGRFGISEDTVLADPMIDLTIDLLNAHRDGTIKAITDLKTWTVKFVTQTYGLRDRHSVYDARRRKHDAAELKQRVAKLTPFQREFLVKTIHNALVERRLPEGGVQGAMQAQGAKMQVPAPSLVDVHNEVLALRQDVLKLVNDVIGYDPVEEAEKALETHREEQDGAGHEAA